MTADARPTAEALREAVTRSGLVAIIRCPEAGRAADIGRVLIDHGVTCLEVALTTPDALEAITALRAHAAGAADPVLVGAGTVLTASAVVQCLEAGAQFSVTPAWCEGVTASVEATLPVLAGAWTPSEILQAHLAGAAAVKVFPAASGGPAHLRAVRDPLPQVPLLAVGGVGLDQVSSYRAAGAIAVGIGSPLIGDAAIGGSLTDLADRATRFVAGCRA